MYAELFPFELDSPIFRIFRQFISILPHVVEVYVSGLKRVSIPGLLRKRKGETYINRFPGSFYKCLHFRRRVKVHRVYILWYIFHAHEIGCLHFHRVYILWYIFHAHQIGCLHSWRTWNSSKNRTEVSRISSKNLPSSKTQGSILSLSRCSLRKSSQYPADGWLSDVEMR